MTVFKGSIWLVSSRAVSILAAFLSVAAISRTLGPEAFGQLSYVLALVAIVAPLGQFGLNAIVVQDIVKVPEKTGAILGSTLVVRIAATVVSLLIATLLVVFLRPDSESFHWFVPVLMAAEIVRAWSACSFAFEANRSFSLIAIVNACIAIVFAAIKVVFALQGADLAVFVVLFAVEAAIAGPVFYLMYRRKFDDSKLSASREQVKSLTRRSGFLAISGVLAVANLKLDQIMLGNMAGDAAAGIYAVAVRLSEFWFFIPTLVATAVFPALVEMHTKNEAAFRALFQKALDALALLSLVVLAAMALLAGPLVQTFFGENYVQSAAIIIIHMWGGIFVAMRAMASKWLVCKDLFSMSLVSHGLGTVGNFLLNLLLIPAYGPYGAAIATVVSYSLSGYLVFFLRPDTRPVAILMTYALLIPFRLPRMVWEMLSRNKKPNALTSNTKPRH